MDPAGARQLRVACDYVSALSARRVMTVLSAVPTRREAARMKAAMPIARRPYSVADAPARHFRNRVIAAFIRSPLPARRGAGAEVIKG